MNEYVILRANCAERVHFFGEQPELAPLSAKETALFTSLTTTWTALKAAAVRQGAGNRVFHDGTLERRLIASELRAGCREIAEVAKAIELEGVMPGISERFRMPRRPTYAVLIATAEDFAAGADPIKALFIERGLAATFVDDLEGLVADFGASSGTRFGGLSNQTEGTAGLEVLADAALKLVQQLRPIISAKLKNQPALLAAWKLASRVESRGTGAESVTPPAPEPPGSGS
jgi:hypothetical protein